ncbi:MAG TPA: glutathione S-transferase family protein [Steroidobacteraceae bacterium]|nr:glutathione S-transferase family protein [Steroidobacteraceae bacterium]
MTDGPHRLELYHFGAVANSLKPLLCLAEKGLEFTSHRLEGAKFEQYSAAFLAINPLGQVPVLRHEGHVIRESTVINEYLDEVFPVPALRPTTAYDRAQMRIWTKFVDEYFCPALTILGAHNARHYARQIPRSELDAVLERIPLKEVRDKWATIAGDSYSDTELEEARRKLGVCAQRLEQALATRTWLLGGRYSLADVSVFSMAITLPNVLPERVNAAATPQLMRWHAAMSERPAVRKMLAEHPRRGAPSAPSAPDA